MSDLFDPNTPFYWQPSSEIIQNARLTQFMRLHGFKTFEEFYQRSVEDIAWFTDALIDFLDIRFFTPYSQVMDTSAGIPWTRWCVGGKLNIVHNCLDKYIGTPQENQPAIAWEGEEGAVRQLTYRELWVLVNQASCGLRSLGVQKGDAVGFFMPMVPEIVVAILAIARIGGVILPLFSGFGAGAVATRLQDANARVLFTADGVHRRGKIVNMKEVADEAAAQVPSLEYMIVFNRCDLAIPMQPGRDHYWNDLILCQSPTAPTEETSAEDMLMIIYTSGTTGRPKGTVHTHCSFPVKAAQDMAFGTDVHPGEIVYWVTDMGWMMGPWLVFGSLLLGATLFIYDGAPDYPNPDRVWSLVERHHITTLGISPTLIRSMIPHGEELVRAHDLSSLRIVASTGEPWNPDAWKWLFDIVCQKKVPIINYTGGTEIGGGILMSNPILPVKPCAFSAPCPGMAADVLNEAGEPVRSQVGELVVRAPWIGMTRGFWKDPERYLETYWSRWPDTWVHGDWAALDPDGQWFLLGRSDDTIKIAGKRLGPAEVESLIAAHPCIQESAAIGVPDPIKGSQLVIFCVLKPGFSASDALKKELRDLIVHSQGKALAPKEIYFIKDLPKTRNAKIMRRMIRSAFLDLDPGDTSSLVNPEIILEIRASRQAQPSLR